MRLGGYRPFAEIELGWIQGQEKASPPKGWIFITVLHQNKKSRTRKFPCAKLHPALFHQSLTKNANLRLLPILNQAVMSVICWSEAQYENFLF